MGRLGSDVSEEEEVENNDTELNDTLILGWCMLPCVLNIAADAV